MKRKYNKILVAICTITIMFVLTACGNNVIKNVQEGYLIDFPNATVKELVENVLPNAKWTSEVTEDYEVVIAEGTSADKDTYEIQFWVESENKEFDILMITKNGEVCSTWQELLELEKWYVDYAKKHDGIDYTSDVAAELLMLNLEELYEIFEYDYDSLGYLYGSLMIAFADDACPYYFCMESAYDNEYVEYLMYDSIVEGVIVVDEETLINEEVNVGMTYDELSDNTSRGITGILEWSDMDEVWCTYVYYDGYNIRFEFLEEDAPSYMALITLTE